MNGRTGVTREIVLDQPVPNGDGLLRQRPHALRGPEPPQPDRRRSSSTTASAAARCATPITDPRFDVPTTIAPFKDFIYAVNARFDRPDESDDDIVRVGDSHHR